MSDDSVELVDRALLLLFLQVGGHVQSRQGKLDVSADLGGKVRIKTKSLEVHTQHFWKLHYAHLFQTILEAVEVKGELDNLPRGHC